MTYVLSPTPAVSQKKRAAEMILSIIGTLAHMGVQPTFSTTKACAFTLPSERHSTVRWTLVPYNPGGTNRDISSIVPTQ